MAKIANVHELDELQKRKSTTQDAEKYNQTLLQMQMIRIKIHI